MPRMLSVLIVSAAFGPFALADDPAEEHPGKPPAEQSRQHQDGDGGPRGFRPPAIPLMTALDIDKNGELSADEIENAATTLKTLDGNNDGKLTTDELRPQYAFRGNFEFRRDRFRNPGPPPDRSGDRPPRRSDEEGRPDGRPHEHPPHEARGPERPERPGPERFGFRGPGWLIDQMMSVDQDDDAELSKEEFLKLFVAVDRDGNGSVTRWEIEETLREQAGTQFGRGPRPPQEGRGHGPNGPEARRPDQPDRSE